jgi:hypothetical protein
VTLRRLATSAIAVWVACVCALAVPVSQLRTYAAVTTCCCPDPAHCHCPDHQAGHSKDSQLRACHRSTDFSTSADPPELVVPQLAIATVVVYPIVLVVPALPQPHPAPPPVRPDAPS